jgi:hypothetical protein
MIQTLDELAQYIRQNLPQPKSITNLQLKENAGMVTFHWQVREFVVKRSLEVLEIKGQNIFITGASMLMQSALMKADKNEKIIDSLVDALRQAEDLLTDQRERDSGLKLIGTVISTLKKLIGR